MGIFDRMGKVISSNVNSLLDRTEDERKLIELNLDEMQEQLRRGRQDVVSAVAAEKQLRKKVEEATADIDRWDKRAELALKTGDEALAREALKAKKKASGDLAIAEKARAEARDNALQMKAELDRMEQKLEEYKLRKNTMATRAEQSKAGGEEGVGARGGSSAFRNFREMEERIEGREAQASAMVEVEEALGKGTKERDLEAKFRELETGRGSGEAGSPDIEDELAAIKKRIRV